MTKEIIVYDNEVLAEYANEQYDATFSKTNTMKGLSLPTN